MQVTQHEVPASGSGGSKLEPLQHAEARLELSLCPLKVPDRFPAEAHDALCRDELKREPDIIRRARRQVLDHREGLQVLGKALLLAGGRIGSGLVSKEDR